MEIFRFSRLSILFGFIVLFGARELKAEKPMETLKTEALSTGLKRISEIIKKYTVQFPTCGGENTFDRNLELSTLYFNKYTQGFLDDMNILETGSNTLLSVMMKMIGITIIIDSKYVAKQLDDDKNTAMEYKINTSTPEFERAFLEEVLDVGPVYGIGASICKEIQYKDKNKQDMIGTTYSYIMAFSTGSEVLDLLRNVLSVQMFINKSETNRAIQFRYEFLRAANKDAELNICNTYANNFTLIWTTLNEACGIERSLLQALQYGVQKHNLKNTEKTLYSFFVKANEYISVAHCIGQQQNVNDIVSYGIASWEKNDLAYMAVFYVLDEDKEERFGLPLKGENVIHIPQSNHSKNCTDNINTGYTEKSESLPNNVPAFGSEEQNKNNAPTTPGNVTQADRQLHGKQRELVDMCVQAVLEAVHYIRLGEWAGIKLCFYNEFHLPETEKAKQVMQNAKFLGMVEKYKTINTCDPMAQLIAERKQNKASSRIMIFRVSRPGSPNPENLYPLVKPVLQQKPQCYRSDNTTGKSKEIFNVTRLDAVGICVSIHIEETYIYFGVLLEL